MKDTGVWARRTWHCDDLVIIRSHWTADMLSRHKFKHFAQKYTNLTHIWRWAKIEFQRTALPDLCTRSDIFPIVVTTKFPAIFQVRYPSVNQTCHISPQTGSDSPQMGQIPNFFKTDYSIILGSERNLIWKSPGFVPFGANLPSQDKIVAGAVELVSVAPQPGPTSENNGGVQANLHCVSLDQQRRS